MTKKVLKVRLALGTKSPAMDSQMDHSRRELPLHIERAFLELYSKLPSDEARLRLWKLKEIFKLESNDALWSVLVALEHHYALYQSLPVEMEALSIPLVTSITNALEKFKLYERDIAQTLTSLGDASLSELVHSMTSGIEDEFLSAHQKMALRLARVMEYVHGIGADPSLILPVKREYQRMTEQYQSELMDVKFRTKLSIQQIVEPYLVRMNRKLVTAILSVSGILLLIALYLAISLIRHSSWDDAAQRTTQSQHALQLNFYRGLDTSTRAILDRRNAQFSPDRQLSFSQPQ